MKKILKWSIIILILLGGLGGFNEQKDKFLGTMASQNSWGIIKLLIKLGANPDAHNSRDLPALHYAVQQGNDEMVDFLIENGADVNYQAEFYGLDYGTKLSPLFVAYADHANNTEMIRKLLDYGADPNELILNAESIISYQQFGTLEALLEAGVTPEPFFEFATLNNDQKAIDIINPYMDSSSLSNNKLHTEVDYKNDNERKETILVDGSDFESSSPLSNEELLVSYIFDNDIENVQMVISDGVNVNTDTKDTRPLIAAIRDGHIEVAKLLLEAGADPNLTESAVNYSPMEAAFDVYSEGDAKPEHFIYELCELLLNYGADPNLEFLNGKTVLENAMDNEFNSIVNLLQNYGAGI